MGKPFTYAIDIADNDKVLGAFERLYVPRHRPGQPPPKPMTPDEQATVFHNAIAGYIQVVVQADALNAATALARKTALASPDATVEITKSKDGNAGAVAADMSIG